MSTMSAQADGVRVLITGGTSGLGAAMAADLVDAGAAVAVTGRDAARVEAATRTLGRGAIGIGIAARLGCQPLLDRPETIQSARPHTAAS